MTDNQPGLTFFLANLEGGGVQKATMRLIHELIRENIRVTLVVIKAGGTVEHEVPDGCTLVDLDCSRARYAFVRLILYLLRERTSTAVSSQTHLNTLLIFVRLLTRYPRQLVVREHITFNTGITMDKRLSERLRPWMIRLFYPFASAVVAVSRQAQASIYQYAGYKKKIHVIQNGLDLAAIHSRADQPPAHQWLENLAGATLVVGMGRLSPQKNFSVLLKAFSLLEKKQNRRLIILGEGPELEKLTTLSRALNIQNQVVFPGYIENPYPILARAGVFVLSSKWEGFANVVIEALACGAPVIATDCPGGPTDILTGKPFARIVPVDDPAAMANAMEAMLTAEKDRGQIIEYARTFSIQQVARQYIDLINELR